MDADRLKAELPVAFAASNASPVPENTTNPDSLPEVGVSSIRRVFYNGEHNAFTDLCRFQSQLYLTFRSCPEGHMVHPTASIIILRSRDDGANWDPVHRFSVKDRDTRDPQSSKRALVSYYSSHERDPSGIVITAIYLAELALKPSASLEGRP